VQRDKAQLLLTREPAHPAVRRLQEQIDLLQQAYEKEKAGVLKRLSSDYEEAVRKEKLLSQAYSSATNALGGQADKASQYATLKRDMELAQQVYTMLLQQSTQAALVALVPSSNIRVVDAAIPVPVPVAPKPLTDITIWALAGGCLGYGLVWLR